jgi:hypothetical protein
MAVAVATGGGGRGCNNDNDDDDEEEEEEDATCRLAVIPSRGWCAWWMIDEFLGLTANLKHTVAVVLAHETFTAFTATSLVLLH